MRIAIVYWLPEGDEPGEYGTQVTASPTVSDFAFEHQSWDWKVLGLLDFSQTTTSDCPHSMAVVDVLTARVSTSLEPDTVRHALELMLTATLNFGLQMKAQTS